MKIGYIGLGLMGKPMASNILKAGFEVIVFNRSQTAVTTLTELGAKPAENLISLIQQVDVIITNLPDSPDVEGIALGREGILENGKPGLILH